MLAVAVLAAGKGTRMKSALPKVLQPLAGATLVERVLTSCDTLHPERRILIVGHQAELVERELQGHSGLEFVLQQPQNGTGHAVQQLLQPLGDFQGDLLVLNGDVPLLRPETLCSLVEQHRTSGARSKDGNLDTDRGRLSSGGPAVRPRTPAAGAVSGQAPLSCGAWAHRPVSRCTFARLHL